MSIQSILNFIINKNYININNELSVSNYFRGDMNEFNSIGNNYINYFKNNFNNYSHDTQTSIIIKDNNLWFYIQYKIDNNEIYWEIYIVDNINKLNNRFLH
jgi:hypothetical protein